MAKPFSFYHNRSIIRDFKTEIESLDSEQQRNADVYQELQAEMMERGSQGAWQILHSK